MSKLRTEVFRKYGCVYGKGSFPEQDNDTLSDLQVRVTLYVQVSPSLVYALHRDSDFSPDSSHGSLTDFQRSPNIPARLMNKALERNDDYQKALAKIQTINAQQQQAFQNKKIKLNGKVFPVGLTTQLQTKYQIKANKKARKHYARIEQLMFRYARDNGFQIGVYQKQPGAACFTHSELTMQRYKRSFFSRFFGPTYAYKLSRVQGSEQQLVFDKDKDSVEVSDVSTASASMKTKSNTAYLEPEQYRAVASVTSKMTSSATSLFDNTGSVTPNSVFSESGQYQSMSVTTSMSPSLTSLVSSVRSSMLSMSLFRSDRQAEVIRVQPVPRLKLEKGQSIRLSNILPLPVPRPSSPRPRSAQEKQSTLAELHTSGLFSRSAPAPRQGHSGKIPREMRAEHEMQAFLDKRGWAKAGILDLRTISKAPVEPSFLDLSESASVPQASC